MKLFRSLKKKPIIIMLKPEDGLDFVRIECTKYKIGPLRKRLTAELTNGGVYYLETKKPFHTITITTPRRWFIKEQKLS